MLLLKDLFLPEATGGHHSAVPGSVPHYGAATAAGGFVAGLGNGAESDRWFGPRQPAHGAHRQVATRPAAHRTEQTRAVC